MTSQIGMLPKNNEQDFYFLRRLQGNTEEDFKYFSEEIQWVLTGWRKYWVAFKKIKKMEDLKDEKKIGKMMKTKRQTEELFFTLNLSKLTNIISRRTSCFHEIMCQPKSYDMNTILNMILVFLNRYAI